MWVVLLLSCATYTIIRGDGDPPLQPQQPPPQPPSDLGNIPRYSPPEALGKAYGHDKSEIEHIQCKH